jgi:hypothetical protein
MADDIRAQIQALPDWQKPELLALWRELFPTSPHPKLRRRLMIPILAYRLQEKAYGGLKPSTRQGLQKLAEEQARNRKAPLLPASRIKTGSKLLRQWRGQMHQVLVVEEGFEYRGQRYQSLSQIACQITGTRWSGPLFFGLKPARKERSAP